MNIFDKLEIKTTDWVSCIGDDYDQVVWVAGPKCTRAQWDAAKTALVAAEPLRLLRIERDRLLAESDWWASSDLTMSAKRKSYRQALRDLPASASPSLDESGQLTGVTWPTKPV